MRPFHTEIKFAQKWKTDHGKQALRFTWVGTTVDRAA